MDRKLVRFFKVTIAAFVILLLGVISGFVTTVRAEDAHVHTFGELALIDETNHGKSCSECGYVSDLAEHNTNGGDTCVGCNASYTVSHTVGDVTTRYYKFESVVEAVLGSGGKVTLLANVDGGRLTFETKNSDVVLDLAGFEIRGVRYYARGNTMLTIMDSSEAKTGVLCEDLSVTSSLDGTLVLDGITVTDGGFSCQYDTSELIIKDTVLKGFDGIYYEKGTASITNVTAECRFQVSLSTENYDKNVVINSGSFSEIYIATSTNWEVRVNDFLPQGYAYSGNNGIIDGNHTSIKDVTEIVEHTEHSKAMACYDAFGHWEACLCGHIEEVSYGQHTMGEDGNCPACGQKIKATVDDGASLQYVTNAEAAFQRAFGLEAATITLYYDGEIDTDFEIENDLILDLHGFTLTVDGILDVMEYGSFTLRDTSKEQSGCLTAERVNFTVVRVAGKMTIESGEVVGILAIGGAEDGDYASITVNGGLLSGASAKFNLSDRFKVVINGGRFKGISGIFNYKNAEFDGSVTINGGTFENCQSFIFSSETQYYQNVNLYLGSDNGCQRVFVDEMGNEYVFPDGEYGYDGTLVVHHSDYTISSDEISHFYYCNICKTEYGTGAHGNYICLPLENDAEKHSTVCGFCGYTESVEAHTGGKATCIEKAVCNACNTPYGELAKDNHTGGVATCIEKAVCSACNTPYGELDSEKHASNEIRLVPSADDPDKHNKIYVCCGEIIDTGSHENGVATCASRAICSECNGEYGSEPSGHKYINGCDASCEICGQGREIGGHVYENACDNECNECGAKRTTAHLYGTDGKCINCGNSTTPADKIEEKLSTGAIVGIAVGTVVVFGAGAFALIWFVLRKKFI